ncbi:MAG: excinuclease ABC subunit UvrC [Lachnospiraceae bacterium]|nr:excinuclease ABC subunit UvrC [Lachnospiraceae bacterium]
MFDIGEELKKLPDSPGVYLMHDKFDTIIYVGKAVSLKNRVRQYFQQSRKVSPKIERMISQIVRFEYIVTDSEVEALVLECNLIKEHSPKYNTMLKDDKSYPYIKATIQEPYPRLLFVHDRKRDAARYFGPYTSVGAMKETLDFLIKTYSLRTCNKKLCPGKIEGRACLYHHIDRCSAPCQGLISEEEYNKNFEKALQILSGNYMPVIRELTELMKEASDNMEYERAAIFRDRIQSIRRVAEKQKASGNETDDRDIIAMASENDEAVVQVFFIRNGKMIGREHHYLSGVTDESEADIISSFIKQYYADTPYIPREILIPCELEDAEVISAWLSEKREHKVYLLVPKIGEKDRLVKLAKNNAELVLKKDSERLKKEERQTTGAMKELAKLLNLDGLTRVESFDISNTGGFESVGSMVVFEHGKPKKHDYRKFKIRTVKGPDDYASMREVLTRRIEHGLKDINNNEEGFAKLPDIILMDGGRGQVNIALEVLDSFGLMIPVCGMVKDDKHRTRGLYFNNIEIPIDTGSECFKLITRIQDETHRFAIEYHRSLRSKEQVHSILDDIKGIGPARRKALVRYFKSIEAIRDASVDELCNVPNFNKNVAESVYDFFHGGQDNA